MLKFYDLAMNNNSKSLQNIYFIRQTPYVLLSRLFISELLFVVFYLVFRLPKFVFFEFVTLEAFYNLSVLSLIVFGVVSLLQLVITMLVTLSWTNEYYVIRSADILHRRGLFNLKEETYSLKNVASFTVEQNFIGRIFNFGSIKFYSPVLKQEYFLNNITNPIKLKETIEETVDSIQNGSSEKKKEFIIPLRSK